MASDSPGAMRDLPDSLDFAEFLARQLYYRNLSEAVLLRITPESGIQPLAAGQPV